MVTMQLIARCFEAYLTQYESYVRYAWTPYSSGLHIATNFDRVDALYRWLFKLNLAALGVGVICIPIIKLPQLVP